MPTVADDVDERPLICNAFSVNGILYGRKTQTRRLTGLDKINEAPDEWVEAAYDATRESWYFLHETGGDEAITCPYGQPGDVLWVREAFRLPEDVDKMSPSSAVVGYRDSPEFLRAPVHYCADQEEVLGSIMGAWGRKRPSIFMPYDLCRLRLRVEEVRVERVQEIGQKDARAEGVGGIPEFDHYAPDYRKGFKRIWNDIRGPDAWERNEWVWYVSFDDR